MKTNATQPFDLTIFHTIKCIAYCDAPMISKHLPSLPTNLHVFLQLIKTDYHESRRNLHILTVADKGVVTLHSAGSSPTGRGVESPGPVWSNELAQRLGQSN